MIYMGQSERYLRRQIKDHEYSIYKPIINKKYMKIITAHSHDNAFITCITFIAIALNVCYRTILI